MYVFPESRDYLPGPFTHAAAIVRLFSELVAPFPYEKLAHLQSSTRYGGMENAGAIFYADARVPPADQCAPALIAHETAHQWFGDAVTEREWSHVWLSEGFRDVLRGALGRAIRGRQRVSRRTCVEIRDQIVKAPEVASRPVIDTTQTDPHAAARTRTATRKGAGRCTCSGHSSGDSAFFRGVRSYYLANRHSTALTDDLRRAVEGDAQVAR